MADGMRTDAKREPNITDLVILGESSIELRN